MNSPFRPPGHNGAQGTGAVAVAPREPTPGERVARAKVLARRALSYWKVATLLFVIGCVIAVVVAINVKRIYKSECVVLVKPAMKTDDR